MKLFFPIFFLLCVPAANWLISNVGTRCIPEGPCLVPVAPGILAPSGVLLIGLALCLRDAVQHEYGKQIVLLCILIGGILSSVFAPPALILASVTAFLLSEFADFFVYSPLADRKRFVLAVVMSGMVGILVDSVIFLYLAFGSLMHLDGQVLGKLYGVGAAAMFVAWRIRVRRFQSSKTMEVLLNQSN